MHVLGELAEPTGYESSQTERIAAHRALVLVAHGVMSGQDDDHPFWHGSLSKKTPDFDHDFRRVRYLALPPEALEQSQGYTAAELRLLEDGGSPSVSCYSLLVGNTEIVWNNLDPDVIVCEVDSSEIIDGWDAPEFRWLAYWLKSDATLLYDPLLQYINRSGELTGKNLLARAILLLLNIGKSA